jgi:hypothetical protein
MNGTTIETATIRATPGGDVIRTVKANTKLDITLDIGSWYKVNSVDDVAQAGYINGRSVKITITPPPPPPPPTGKVVTNIITVYDDGSILVTPQ